MSREHDEAKKNKPRISSSYIVQSTTPDSVTKNEKLRNFKSNTDNPRPNLPKAQGIRYKDNHLRHSLPPPINEISRMLPSESWSMKAITNRIPIPTQSSITPPHQAKIVQTETNTQRGNLNDAVEQYNRFIPRLNQVTANNFVGVLVDVLRETEGEISIQDFFRLLYTTQPLGSKPLITAVKDSMYEFSTLEARSRGSALCRLIHDTFMDPLSASTYLGMDTENSSITNVNAHEFHRVFLATKILLHCIKEVKQTSESKSSLPKASVFNIYQIYVYRLFSANSSNLDDNSSPESIILGQASTGKLMKLIFNGLSSQRLGSRGNSKYHFTGVAWKEAALDNETSDLLQLEPWQVKQHFKNSIQKVGNQPQPAVKKLKLPVTTPNTFPQSSRVSSASWVPTPLFSYVSSSSRFPSIDFFPRVREIIPRRVPQQSEWLRGVMNGSLNVLKLHNVNLEHLIQDFQSGDFSIESEQSLYCAISRAEKKLDQNSSSEEAYLHLHLAVLTLMLPAVLASDEEITPASKILLRACMRRFVKDLELRQHKPARFEKNHRRIFVTNIQKLIHISETISAAVPKELATDILQVVYQDIVGLQKKGNVSGDATALDNICTRSVITMLNAYPHVFPTSEQEKIALINRILEIFHGMCAESNMDISRMIADINSPKVNFNVEGLRFEIFKSFVETLHKWLLHKAFYLEIPMPVLRFYLSQLDMEIQTLNYQAFGKRDPKIAAEAFKTWWLITAAFHEYIIIISEIVAISQWLG